MRASTILELLNPLLAFTVVILAALAGTPSVLVLLAPLWLLPAHVARHAARGLDEREIGIRDRAERLALRTLLLLACAAPLLGGERVASGLSLLRREWADAGMLLVAIFVVRGLGFAAGALSSSGAARYAGGMATAMGITWSVALAFLRPPLAPLLLVLGLLPLVPQIAEPVYPRVAGVLWIGGAITAALIAVGTGMIAIEIAVVVALTVIPWGAAGWWSLRPRLA